jgi:hypothetical protein
MNSMKRRPRLRFTARMGAPNINLSTDLPPKRRACFRMAKAGASGKSGQERRVDFAAV